VREARPTRFLALLAAAAVTVSAQTAYQREISQWRAQREAKLKAEDGWLTVVGLHWLHEGVNTVGSDPKADAPLPASLPARVGTITLTKGKVHFKPATGVQLKDTGIRLPEMDLKTDITPEYDRLALGRVKFFVIQREDRFAVRVKDNDSEARKKFAGLRWYAVDPSWKIKATFIPSPHPVTFDTEVGVKETDESPGYVTCTRPCPKTVSWRSISTRPRIRPACSPITPPARCLRRRIAWNWPCPPGNACTAGCNRSADIQPDAA
jgi:uncharacterized protein (DUF1684 family)